MNRKTEILLVAALALAASCSKSDSKSGAEAAVKPAARITVTTAPAVERPLEKSLLVTGSLAADESVTISPEVAGRIVAIQADFGQFVKKGQVVAQLDRTEYQIQLERTRAALSQALARLGLKAGQENTPPTSTASARQAQAQLEDAKFKFESAARLVKTGDISQERYTEIEKMYHARQAAYDSTQDDLRTLWSSVEGLRADVKLAEKRLNDTTLRAPFDGAIMQKHLSVGQYIKDNTPILTLVKTWPLRMRVEVPESAAGAVKTGTSLVFTTDAAPGAEFHATVKELNPSVDSKNRSLTVEARLTENDRRLRPGMFVQVRLITDRSGNSVMIPRRAVYSIAGLTKFFIIRNGRAVERKVAPGREMDGYMEVPEGAVKAGDPVAVSNTAMLAEGVEVQTKE